MWPLIASLLFAAPVTPSRPVVVITEGADSAHVSSEAVSALERVGLHAQPIDLSAFLEVKPKRCETEMACLCSAPALKGIENVLVVRISPLSASLRAVDLRQISCKDSSRRLRISVVLADTELTTWVHKFLPKLALASH
jgi:hypothetical protein